MTLDRLADAMADLLTDPHARMNQLKKPARCVCMECGAKYTRRVTMLADPNHGCCSHTCDMAYQQKLRSILKEAREGSAKWH